MTTSISTTDRTLMLLPFEEWISISAAAQRADIDEDAAASVVRAGRRRGVLRTRGKGPAQQVRRIYPAPRRAPATPKR
ncbi:hypothetical protein ABZ419_19655 [Streptomyces cinnamoneus]|uniref:hypothetical protein n=1 Tax=Streptomyces cinnamoneus TaxID=53446 RepID=UPI00340E440A